MVNREQAQGIAEQVIQIFLEEQHHPEANPAGKLAIQDFVAKEDIETDKRITIKNLGNSFRRDRIGGVLSDIFTLASLAHEEALTNNRIEERSQNISGYAAVALGLPGLIEMSYDVLSEKEKTSSRFFKTDQWLTRLRVIWTLRDLVEDNNLTEEQNK